MSVVGEPKLTDYKALVFDVYGTLADWESGIYNGLKPLLDKYPASQGWDRKDALTAYAAVERDLEAQFPEMLYSDLLAKISEVLEERLKSQSGNGGGNTSTLDGSTATAAGSASSSAGPSTSGQLPSAPSPTTTNPHVAFGRSVQDWSVFPDSSAALHELAKDYKLVVLSNVDHDSFRYTHAKLSTGAPATNPQELAAYTKPNSPSTATEKQKLPYAKYWHPQETPNSRSPFSLVLTAQDNKCYKPALGGFLNALECIRTDPALLGDLGLNRDEVKKKVLVVAQSLEHDHEPAHQMGLTSVWIDRPGAVTCKNVPEGTRRWTWRFETLGEMAEAVAGEKRVSV